MTTRGLRRPSYHALFILSLIALISTNSFADEIFRWTDQDGQVHYSTQKSDTNASAAELPPLEKENLDEKIKLIKQDTPRNCLSHGGVDCAAGPDDDGSVICIDGFRGAILPHRFRCREAKLKSELSLVYEGEDNGVAHSTFIARQNRNKRLREVRVTVRNETEIEAFGVQVELDIPGQVKKTLRIEGAEKVEPYGFADYTVPFDPQNTLTVYQVSGLHYRVHCENCR